MAENILFNTASQKTLKFLLENPGVEFYDREVSRLSGIKKSSANYALKSLAEKGIAFSRTRGRTIFYRVEAADPLVIHLKKVLNLSAAKPLADALRGEARTLIMYGPAAAGLNAAGADIDLLVAGDNIAEIERIITESTADDAIACLVKTMPEYIRLESAAPGLHAEISRGIRII